MSEYEMRLLASGVLGAIGAALTVARRYRNEDTDAGRGTAGWTIFIIFLLWLE
jgi:hypothetical protein